MAALRIDHFVVGPVQTNCYFLVNQMTKEVLIIDPGASGPALADKILSEGLHPVAVLLTHAHFDHAGDAEYLEKKFQIPVYVHEAEADTLTDPDLNASWMIGEQACYKADRFVKDGEELNLAGFAIRVLFTPGHTPGGCCYYLPGEGVLFSGDSLFRGSIGRTDFKGGSAASLVRAIREKLMTLPDNTAVYPGHNEITDIGYERKYNPFI